MKERDHMIYRLMNMDAEGDRDESETHHGGGNTRLPYGLCKALGIDTTGFSPKDCWKALKGEGVSPTEAYASLQKTGSAKTIVKEAKDRQILKEERGWQSKQFAEVDKKYPQAKRAIDHATQTFKSLKGTSGEKAVLMKNVRASLNNVLKEDLKQGGHTDVSSNFEYMRKMRRDSVRKMVAHADVQYVYYQQKHLESQIKKDEATGIMTATVAEEKKQLKDFLEKNIKRIDKLYGEEKQGKFAPETYKLWYEKVRPAMIEGLGWGKSTTSASSEKKETLESVTITSAKQSIAASKAGAPAKPSTPSAKANGKSGVSKSRATAINALKKLALSGDFLAKEVYKGSDGRQFYTNGYMAIRLNDGNELSSKPKDCSRDKVWQDAAYGIIDRAKDENHKEIDLGFTADDLEKYIKSVNEKEKNIVPSSRCYTIRIKGYSEKEGGKGDNKWSMGVNAKLLLNTMKQFDNPKFYVGTDVKGEKYSDDQRRNGIYIKGDNGEGVVLPVWLPAGSDKTGTRREIPYIGAINTPKATTSGGLGKTEWA